MAKIPHSKFVYLLFSLIFVFFIFFALSPKQMPAQEIESLGNSRDNTDQTRFQNVNKKYQLAQKKSEFYNSICFENCHQKENLSPKNKTVTQWKFLIQERGHAIFKEIPWENSTQKNKIMQFLIENAKGTGEKKEGIGVWN